MGEDDFRPVAPHPGKAKRNDVLDVRGVAVECGIEVDGPITERTPALILFRPEQIAQDVPACGRIARLGKSSRSGFARALVGRDALADLLSLPIAQTHVPAHFQNDLRGSSMLGDDPVDLGAQIPQRAIHRDIAGGRVRRQRILELAFLAPHPSPSRIEPVFGLVFLQPLPHQRDHALHRLDRIGGAAGVESHRGKAPESWMRDHAVDEGHGFRTKPARLSGRRAQVPGPVRILKHLGRSHLGEQVDHLDLRMLVQRVPGIEKLQPAHGLAGAISHQMAARAGIEVQRKPVRMHRVPRPQFTVDAVERYRSVPVQLRGIPQQRLDACALGLREWRTIRPCQIVERAQNAELLKHGLRLGRPGQCWLQLAMAHHRRGRAQRPLMKHIPVKHLFPGLALVRAPQLGVRRFLDPPDAVELFLDHQAMGVKTLVFQLQCKPPRMAPAEVLAEGLATGLGHRLAQLLDARLHFPRIPGVPEPSLVAPALAHVTQHTNQARQAHRLARGPGPELMDAANAVFREHPFVVQQIGFDAERIVESSNPAGVPLFSLQEPAGGPLFPAGGLLGRAHPTLLPRLDGFLKNQHGPIHVAGLPGTVEIHAEDGDGRSSQIDAQPVAH